MNFVIGFLASFLVAFPAYLRQRLRGDGLLAALVVGTLIYGFGTYLTWSIMIGFFLLGSMFKNKTRKQESHGRSSIQVIANSLIALFSVILFFLFQEEAWLMIALIMFIGSASDTLGSEIGTRLKGKTFYITTGQIVPIGLSGGISIQGTLASFFGSALLSLLAVVLRWFFPPLALTPSYYSSPLLDFLLLGGMGFLTSILDSYLGALFQAKYLTSQTSQLSDDQHDKKSQLYAGFSWMTNDLVNTLSNAIVAIITLFFLMTR